MQGEIEEQDGQLQQVQREKASLEDEVTALLDNADLAGASQGDGVRVGARNKGPGAMLHSALQQLQAELKREALANEKLMLKAETLLKEGGGDRDHLPGHDGDHGIRMDGSLSSTGGASAQDQDTLRQQLKEMAAQVQQRETENERLKMRVKELQREATYVKCKTLPSMHVAVGKPGRLSVSFVVI